MIKEGTKRVIVIGELLEKKYMKKEAFKVDSGIVNRGKEAYRIAKEGEGKLREALNLMDGTVHDLMIAVRRAKSGEGDLRNLAPILEEVKGDTAEYRRIIYSFLDQDASIYIGSALSDLGLEVPDTPSLRVIR